MLKLAAIFEDAAGKKHRWSYNEPNPNLSPEQIRALLEKMTTLNLFEKNGVKQFQKLVSAKFVETIETPIFDLSQPVPEAYVADPNNLFAPQIMSDDVPVEKPVADVVTTAVDTVEQPTTGTAPASQPEAAELEDTSPATETPAPAKTFTNPRKEQVDRVRAYHEAKKKKKNRKKRS